jgi:hypothetical protein
MKVRSDGNGMANPFSDKGEILGTFSGPHLETYETAILPLYRGDEQLFEKGQYEVEKVWQWEPQDINGKWIYETREVYRIVEPVREEITVEEAAIEYCRINHPADRLAMFIYGATFGANWQKEQLTKQK